MGRDVFLGKVGGDSIVVDISANVSTAAYAAGDGIGPGASFTPLTVRNAIRVQGGTAMVQSITVIDATTQANGIEFIFFRKPPNVTSTDNAALNIPIASLSADCIGSVGVSSTAYIQMASAAICTIRNIGLVLDTELATACASTDVYVAMRSTGAPTYTATNALTIRFGIFRD